MKSGTSKAAAHHHQVQNGGPPLAMLAGPTLPTGDL